MVENAQNPAPPNLRVRADDVVNRLETVLEGLRVIVGHVHGEPPAQPQPATPLAPPQPTPFVPPQPTPSISSSVSSAHNTLDRVVKLIEEIKGDL